MRQELKISEEQIQTCLQMNYGLSGVKLELLPLGDLVNVWIYRVESANNAPLFLKVKPAPLYQPTCFVPFVLKQQGVTRVVAPLPTLQNQLWSELDKYVLILYPFIEGHNGWKPGMTNQNWHELGKIVRQIQDLTLPAEIQATIRTETFQPIEPAWIRDFDSQLESFVPKDEIDAAIVSAWLAHRPTIQTVVAKMEQLRDLLRVTSRPLVICHADLHPGNVLIDRSNQLFLIDWDDVKLAPKERDFIFVGEGDNPATAPFFQGYGAIEIDWVALTYYRCERVAQDVMVYTQTVIAMPDLTDETRAAAVKGFQVVFQAGSEVEDIFSAARHLPAHLAFA